MSVPTTYATLQAKVVDLLHRTGDTVIEALAPDWIGYAESEMQEKLKLLEMETTSAVTITAGVGTLPTGYVGMRSVYWDGSPDRELSYIPPTQYDILRSNDSGDGDFYTIRGSSILTTPMGSGSIVCTYLGRFTPLSTTDTTNAILTTYPEVYVYGAMKHACLWTGDDAGVQKFGLLFNGTCERITVNNEQRKYGHSLTVRAR
jgi:hypothetical protein